MKNNASVQYYIFLIELNEKLCSDVHHCDCFFETFFFNRMLKRKTSFKSFPIQYVYSSDFYRFLYLQFLFTFYVITLNTKQFHTF